MVDQRRVSNYIAVRGCMRSCSPTGAATCSDVRKRKVMERSEEKWLRDKHIFSLFLAASKLEGLEGETFHHLAAGLRLEIWQGHDDDDDPRPYSQLNTSSLFQGLTVVDVYSDWSGPCSAMTNFLKKIKLEVNDDLLSYAMAKTDKIPQLKIFKGYCKPIWLFIASGILHSIY